MQGAATAALLRPLASLPPPTAVGAPAAAGETLYNGIVLPTPWPPRLIFPSEHPVTPSYLAEPPSVVPIDAGRQLFVDEFLIEETNLTRTFHPAEYHPASPVLKPEQPWELRDEYADRTQTPPSPAAMVFSDGVFFDPADRLFKMWYMAGYQMNTGLAISDDGIAWRRPSFDVVKGTNIVLVSHRDSSTVWLDLFESDPSQRYKMAFWHDHKMWLYSSADGVHWRERASTGPSGDRSTLFYNPFRRVWVFSIRADQSKSQISGRYRRYWESPDFLSARNWGQTEPVAWVKADSRDRRLPQANRRPELYNLDCVAYESVLLGLFSILRGESNTREKINEICVGFSRDGFQWQRAGPQSFAGVSEEPGSWNWANVQSAGGGCLIVGERLHFYVSGRAGRPGTSLPGICSTGLATLRRDGFASMDWMPGESPVLKHGPEGIRTGVLTTRPVRFSGGHVFVNADTAGGELRVEVLDQQGNPVAPFTRESAVPVRGNGTRLPVRWQQSATVATVSGRAVRFRFTLDRGRLYAFWVSQWPSGESRGFPAAGGPEFRGPVDSPA